MDLPYVCSLFYHVQVTWQRVVEQPTPIERGMLGREAGDVVDNTYCAVWPHDRFTRDDIDHPEVQRGFRSMTVSPVTRAYHHAANVTLQLHKGRLRVALPGSQHDPFFAGFARDVLTAARWVATGTAELLVPWENRQ